MTNKQFEQIESLSKKLWGDINNGYEYSMVTYSEFLGIVTEVWEKLQEEPVSEDLEEAAEEWDESLYRSDAFKAGAKWQKEKMMKDAVDAHCFGFQGAALFSFRLPAGSYLIDSKVKVIVIKKD